MDHLRYKFMNAFDAAMNNVAGRFKYLAGLEAFYGATSSTT
jgi:1,4-alpha-glucan branching enzyme